MIKCMIANNKNDKIIKITENIKRKRKLRSNLIRGENVKKRLMLKETKQRLENSAKASDPSKFLQFSLYRIR